MRYSALVNGKYVIAANNIKTLKRKASMICNKDHNTMDEMIIEGLGKRNRPVLLSRSNSTSYRGRTHLSDWE